MWLTKKETAEKAESVKTGVVTTGGGEISVCTELERRAPTVTVPYGMAVSVPRAIPQHARNTGVMNPDDIPFAPDARWWV